MEKSFIDIQNIMKQIDLLQVGSLVCLIDTRKDIELMSVVHKTVENTVTSYSLKAINLDGQSSYFGIGNSLDELKKSVLFYALDGCTNPEFEEDDFKFRSLKVIVPGTSTYTVNENYYVAIAYANEVEENVYGEISQSFHDIRRYYPGSKLMNGYIIIDRRTKLCPDDSKDWYFTLKEALSDIVTLF